MEQIWNRCVARLDRGNLMNKDHALVEAIKNDPGFVISGSDYLWFSNWKGETAWVCVSYLRAVRMQVKPESVETYLNYLTLQLDIFANLCLENYGREVPLQFRGDPVFVY